MDSYSERLFSNVPSKKNRSIFRRKKTQNFSNGKHQALDVFSTWIGWDLSLIKQMYFCLLPREHWNYLKYVMKLQLESCNKRRFQHLARSHQTVAQTHQLQFILLRLYSANKRDNTVTKNSIAFKNERKSHVCASGFLFILIHNVNVPPDSVSNTSRKLWDFMSFGSIKKYHPERVQKELSKDMDTATHW